MIVKPHSPRAFTPRFAHVSLALGLLVLPLLLQPLGHHWVRMVDTCLLYVMLALGLNIVVGMAGLLDLGFVAFYALGAYSYAWLASPHLVQQFAGLAALFPDGLHTPWWLVLAVAALLTAAAGALLGAPTLRLKGDYLAVVTLGFGEIIRILAINLDHPINLTDGAKGLGHLDSVTLLGWHLAQPLNIGPWSLAPVTGYYYVFLTAVVLTVVVSHRLHRSRIGRAWMAIRDDEVAAEAMGLPTRRLKLLAFAVGASFGGMAGTLFGAFQGFVSPEAFSLHESVAIVAMVVFGGMGHIPGVIVGAVLLTALPEVLRYVVGPIQSLTDGRVDAGMLRPTLFGLVMVVTMLVRPKGLWPTPDEPARPMA